MYQPRLESGLIHIPNPEKTSVNPYFRAFVYYHAFINGNRCCQEYDFFILAENEEKYQIVFTAMPPSLFQFQIAAFKTDPHHFRVGNTLIELPAVTVKHHDWVYKYQIRNPQALIALDPAGDARYQMEYLSNYFAVKGIDMSNPLI